MIRLKSKVANEYEIRLIIDMRNLKINESSQGKNLKQNRSLSSNIIEESEELERWAESKSIHLVFIIALLMLCSLVFFMLRVGELMF